MKLILKELKPRPGMEKMLESSKKFFKDFGKAFKPEIEKELGGSKEFLALIKINNLQEAFLRSLNLSSELMKKRKIALKSGSGSPKSRISDLIEDDPNLSTKQTSGLNSGSRSPKSRISELIEDDLSQFIKETSHFTPRVADQKLEDYTRRLETSFPIPHEPKDSSLTFSVHSNN